MLSLKSIYARVCLGLSLGLVLISGCATRHHHTQKPLPPKASQEDQETFTSQGKLAHKVEAALLANAELKHLPITVLGSGHIIELRGEVQTAAQKQKAIEIAQHVHGVGAVMDGLFINENPPQ